MSETENKETKPRVSWTEAQNQDFRTIDGLRTAIESAERDLSGLRVRLSEALYEHVGRCCLEQNENGHIACLVCGSVVGFYCPTSPHPDKLCMTTYSDVDITYICKYCGKRLIL